MDEKKRREMFVTSSSFSQLKRRIILSFHILKRQEIQKQPQRQRAMEAVKKSLEERLVEHDSCREEVQGKIKERGARALGDVDSLEERISGEISSTFGKTEEDVSTLIDKLANRKWEGDKKLNSLMDQAHEILSSERKAEIQHSGSREGFASSYELKITSIKKEMNLGPITASDDDDEVVESIVNHL